MEDNSIKWIVYLTINIITNKIYIGIHKTINPNVFDGYIGCGVNINRPSTYKRSKTPFQYAVNKYGIKACYSEHGKDIRESGICRWEQGRTAENQWAYGFDFP